MNRYLLNIAYIGTQFRGIQRTVVKAEEPRIDTSTIQGCIELALQKLRPINPIQITLSSRTDKGVHALHSTVHVDLENASGNAYPPLNITTALNRLFHKGHFPIRVISTTQVPNTFHCRYNAIARTYLYRLAIAKPSVIEDPSSQNFERFIPIEESDRCYFLQAEFDIEKLKEAASLFLGRHDFRTFMGVNKQNGKQNRALFTIRTITDINIAPGTPVTCAFDYDKANQLYNYWNITITGKSFLYKQVRRIVATLVSAGYGRLSKREIYEMLTIPSKNSWNSRIQVMPAFGLYLCKVHYNEEDFKLSEEKLKNTETVITYADGTKYREEESGLIKLTDKSCGFVVDTKPDKVPAIILEEGLMLGSQDSVELSNIQKYGITHILSIGINSPKVENCDVIIFKHVPCLDLPETNLGPVIKESNEFITNAIATGGKVLVHCNAGVSRSAAIVISFLIIVKKFSFEDAYQLVKSKRECIQPNVGFARQLRNL